jgi:hypothetical protein
MSEQQMLETIERLEEASTLVFEVLRRSALQHQVRDPGAAEYDSWAPGARSAGAVEYESWAASFR